MKVIMFVSFLAFILLLSPVVHACNDYNTYSEFPLRFTGSPGVKSQTETIRIAQVKDKVNLTFAFTEHSITRCRFIGDSTFNMTIENHAAACPGTHAINLTGILV